MDYKQIAYEVLSKKRFEHSHRVAQVGVDIANAHQYANTEKVWVAGILHDYAKELTNEQLIDISIRSKGLTTRYDLFMPEILHGPVAAVLLKEKKIIEDEQILQAIRFHTVGHPDMDELAKIIFIADYVEPGRKTPGVESVRKLAFKSLDACIVEIVNKTAEYLIDKNRLIHEDMIRLRNAILTKEIIDK